jgi:hypothetical protein
VEFQSEEMATAALSAFAGVELMGRVLNVDQEHQYLCKILDCQRLQIVSFEFD